MQFKNGIVDVSDPTVLLPPSPEYFTVNPIPWNIGGSDATPTLDRIFMEWVGEKYLPTLYEIIAYCLLASYPLQRLFCLLGDRRNGKSIFLELIRRFIGGDNVCTTELDVLLTSRFEITRLYKKLVCQMGETNFNELKQTSIIKKLTDDDLIGFEFKNKNPFQDKNYAKIIIATNNLPATGDKTDGFYRRWLLVDFPNKFEERIDVLAQIPKEEYENLAFKCIQILRRLLETRQFTNEGSYEERARRYEEKSNPFDKFWTECVEETSPDTFITKSEFQRRLESWCKERKYRILSDISVSQGMKLKGILDDRKHIKWYENNMAKDVQARVWLGIGWKTTINNTRLCLKTINEDIAGSWLTEASHDN